MHLVGAERLGEGVERRFELGVRDARRQRPPHGMLHVGHHVTSGGRDRKEGASDHPRSFPVKRGGDG